ncbi:hypothetical protein diail_5049 [Diaporthe ilicicola]|nr:hypothetical protein diail_5049 [Diaporthe ilicicola]
MTESSKRGMGALDRPFDPSVEQERDLSRLKTPKDLPSQLLEAMRNEPNPGTIVNYPTRLFHLRPQSNLQIPDNLDWEQAFLWQKVSSQIVQARWIQNLPVPALDLPLESFPETLLRQGTAMRMGESTPRELLDFASAVLNTPSTAAAAAVAATTAVAPAHMPWRDIKWQALHIINHFERQNNPEAVAMAAKVRNHKRGKAEMRSFIRCRDSERKPTGMGFRTEKDVLLLDDEFLTDFLGRASQHGAQTRRMRSDVKLVSFLNSQDAAKITTIAVSSLPFQNPASRTYLCYSIARTFPNLRRLLIVSVSIWDRTPDQIRNNPTQFARLRRLENLAAEEALENGGSSFTPHPIEDPAALFDMTNMSEELKHATGAYADGRGRSLEGSPALTPVVAHGVSTGVLHDPAEHPRGQQPPPLVEAVQQELFTEFEGMVRRKQEAARASRAETLSRLEGWRTMLPRPSRGQAASAPGVARKYRRDELPVDLVGWVRAHRDVFLRRNLRPEDASASEPETEASIEASEVVPRHGPRVEPCVLEYDRAAFDRIAQSGWVGFGPGVDLSHLSEH